MLLANVNLKNTWFCQKTTRSGVRILVGPFEFSSLGVTEQWRQDTDLSSAHKDSGLDQEPHLRIVLYMKLVSSVAENVMLLPPIQTAHSESMYSASYTLDFLFLTSPGDELNSGFATWSEPGPAHHQHAWPPAWHHHLCLALNIIIGKHKLK